MTPDDFAALAEIAGPLYQQSKVIESFTSESPIPGAYKDYGSMNIRMGLEQAQRLAQASVHQPPQPSYVQPAEPQYIQQYVEPQYAPSTAAPPIYNPPTTDFSNQLEFTFEKGGMDVTNDLLREISKKLSKLISLVDKTEKEDKIPKLKPTIPNVKNTQI
jgi:hypothetical protein